MMSSVGAHIYISIYIYIYIYTYLLFVAADVGADDVLLIYMYMPTYLQQ